MVSGRTRADLDSDAILMLALTRALEIVGEASKNVSQGFRDRHPELPWQDIAGLRNRLIHEYFNVNLDLLWQIATEDAPMLERQINAVLLSLLGPASPGTAEA